MDDQDFYVLALLGNYDIHDHLSSNTSKMRTQIILLVVNSSRVYPITNGGHIG